MVLIGAVLLVLTLCATVYLTGRVTDVQFGAHGSNGQAREVALDALASERERLVVEIGNAKDAYSECGNSVSDPNSLRVLSDLSKASDILNQAERILSRRGTASGSSQDMPSDVDASVVAVVEAKNQLISSSYLICRG